MNKSIYFIIFIFSFIFSYDDPILVKIKDRIITKTDFIKRSEYTIRPSYCKGDNPIHKKIILNSLIAEKLMAIDIEPFIDENNFSSDFLYGIKEQKMREILLDDEVYSRVEIEPKLLDLHLKNSTRTYSFSFVSIENDTIAAFFQNYLKDGVYFDNICYDYLLLQSIPTRELGYFNEPDKNIHTEIFEKDLNENDILGPIISSDNKYLFIKVLGWTNTVLITEQEKIEHKKLVEEKLIEFEQERKYTNYILDIMKGDKLKFEEEPFFKLADIAYKYYFIRNNPNQDDLDEKYKDNNLDLIYFANKIGLKNDDVFLTFNDDVLTVEELDELISKHPLLFKKKSMDASEFPLYFKYAIVDLMRDEELNRLAYDKKYDFHPEVVKELSMFNDASLSQLHLKALLDNNSISEDEFEQNTLYLIDKYLNIYIDSLQNKYSNEIEIDFDVFDEIGLTYIDLYAYKKGVPYPNVVPLFPRLTSKHQLDYGKKSSF